MKDIDAVLDQLTNPQSNGLVVDNQQGVIGDTVDALQKGAYDGVAGAADFIGADGIRDWAKEGSDDQMREMSQAGRDAMSKQFFQDDENGNLEFGEAWTDGRSIAMQVAHMMGMNADILAGGGIVKGGRMTVTALGKQIKKRLGRKVKDPALLDAAAKHGTEAFLQKLAKRAGAKDPKAFAANAKDMAGKTFDYGVATHAVSSGLGAIDIREEVGAMDYEDLMGSESFKQAARRIKALNPNASPTEILEAARKQVGEQAASNIKTNPALMASNVLVGGLGGVALERLLKGVLPAGAGIATEFGTEAVQGGTEQYASNVAKQDEVDPNQSLSEGVLAAGLNEGVAGAMSSGVFAGGRKLYEKATGKGPQETPAPESDEELNMTAGAQEVVDYAKNKNAPQADQKQPSQQQPQQPTQPVNPKEAATTKQEKSDWEGYFNRRYTTKSPEIDEVTGEISSNEVNRPPYLMRRDGQPYTNEFQARNAAAGFNLRDYVPKKVEGGYIMERPQEKPPEMPLKDEPLARVKMRKNIAQQIKARKDAGEFLNEKEARKAQQMIKEGATVGEVVAQLDKAFTDPTRAAIDKWNDEKARQKAQQDNAKLWESQPEEAEQGTPKHLQWHERNQEALKEEQKRDRMLEGHQANKAEKDTDYDRAVLQRDHEQYMEGKRQEAADIEEATRPTVNDIAAAVKRKRKKIKKALASDPQRRERRQLAQLQAETAKKVEAVISTYSKPLQDAPGYQPNNVFADAIMNVKAVKKAIEKAPDPVRERKLVNAALLEMAAEAERDLMGQSDDGDFTPYNRAIDNTSESELFGDDESIGLDEIEQAEPTTPTSKNHSSFGAQSEAERQEQARQLEASRNRSEQPQQSVDVEPVEQDSPETPETSAAEEIRKKKRRAAIAKLPDSLINEFPNMPMNEKGDYLLIKHLKPEEQETLRKGGLVVLGHDENGSGVEMVDPNFLWGERYRRQEANKDKSPGVSQNEQETTPVKTPFNIDDKHIYGEEKNGKYYVGGDTYKDKDEIKARGGRWNKDERAWEFDDKANAESYVTSDKDSFKTAEYVRETRKALESGVIDSGVHIKESRKGANITEVEVRGNDVLINKTTKIGRRTRETDFIFPLDKVKEHLTSDEVKTLEKLASENAKNAEQESDVTTIDTAANEAATSPTNDLPEPSEAQIEAGNYKKGHVNVAGFDISIENPKGSTRRGKSEDGKAWESTMQHHYGDIKGTKGADGDPVDVFIGDNPSSENVYVINQVDPKTGNFDEHKVMMGFDSLADAKDAYLSNYEKGWKGLDSAEIAKPEELKAWLESGNTNQPYPKSKQLEKAPEEKEKASESVKKPLTTTVPEIIKEAGLEETPAKDNNVTTTTTGTNSDGQTRPRNAASSEGNGEVRGETPKSAEGGSGSDGPASPPSSGAATQGTGNRPTNRTERSDQGSDPTNRFKLDDIGDIANGTASQRVAANLAAIRLSKTLQQENRPATAKEKAVLAQYVGWGGLKRVFDNVGKQAKFEKEAQAELKQLLTPTEFTAVANTVRTAFYTSKDIVKAMWAGVEAFNLTSKTGKINVVEPSVGTGNFIGWQPDTLRDKSNWSATELDPITGTIAQQVYDDANIKVSGFQDAAFKKGVFSLAIGNPPFGSQPLHDKKDKDISGLSLHNYMIAKSAKLLHENGLMMMVITNRFLDTKNANHRDLSKLVDFVGAVRLPNTAFKSNAGTEVTTDIVVFRKLKQGETAQNTVWTDVDGAIDGIRINKYFEQNPQNILGTLSNEGSLYAGREGGELTVNPSPEHADINQSITNALQKMAADYDLAVTDETSEKIAGEVMLSESDLALGGFMVNEDGKVLHRFDDTEAGANVQEITPQSVLTDNGQKLVGVKALLDSNASMEDMLAYTREHLLTSTGTPSVKTKPMEAFYDHVGVNGMSKQRAMSKREVTRIINEGVEKASIGENNYNKLRDILKIRNTALALVKAEKQDSDNIEALRAQLNREYDAFSTGYGKKNKPVAISESVRILGDDLSLESALDSVSATGEIRKHDIFSRRMIEPYVAPTTASNIDDAVTYSIQNMGKVDVAHIAELMGISKLEAKAKLTAGDNPYLFLDPTTDNYVFIDDYLSGNVKKKYQEAKSAGLDKNVAALKRVLPKDKPANKVKASIRATWIDADVFERFLEELGYEATVNVSPTLGRITLESINKLEATELGAQFQHEAVNVDKLFEHATAGRSITVYQGSAALGTKQKDEKATKSANLLVNKMAELFEQWVGTDSDSKEQIARNFNERVNTHVERRYNGRLYFKPVGVNPIIDLRKTQLDGALRIVQSQNSLLDHTVGAGKTFTQIAAIMERKRLGLSKKPLLAVPNHIIGSFASDFYTLYPGANILVVSEKQINAQNRRKFFSKIATSDYDAIIIGHSHLKNLPNSPLAEEQVIQEKLDELRRAKEEAKREAKEAGGRGASVSQIEEAIDRLNGKLKELKEGAEKRDDKIGLNFEEMGIDFLAIDEAHEFKNLMYSTSSDRVVGMNDPKGSQKAFDLLVKARSVQNLGKQGAVSFMTGTPISNSLVELYTMMYYLGYEDLKDNNISHYDAFAGSFLNTENAMEYTATGTLKERVVLKGLNNVKELSTKYRQFADVITHDDMKRIYAEDTEESNAANGENKDTRFPIPNVKGGQRQIDLAPATEQQRLYNDALIARMETISNINGKEERLKYSRLDNPLKVLTDAKKASLDIRLVDPVTQRDKTGKIMRAANNVKRIYDKWEADKGTQLVFSDMGVPVKSALQNAKKELKAIAEMFIPNGAKWADRRLKSLEDSESKYGDIATEIGEMLEVEERNGTTDPEVIEKTKEALHKNAGLFVTADVKFSVYDDLREVLVSKGIPAKEIEFIHDHDTQAKKSKLFERMRAGEVRVLIGSSFKMGAGTNVQDLLVGLHHLDAPWRPSEMEQREGRIIRQGNKLYERAAKAGKPDDFEVEVIAYATQGSSDPVMWQILERKAAAIEQFRQGNIDEFVEEEQSDSDSYAELKAQTTGNPIYREKLKADNEVVETETAYKAALIGYSGAKKVVTNYDTSKGAYQKTVDALRGVDLSDYDAEALENEIVSNIEQYAAAMEKHADDLEAYDKLSAKEKKATKKPKLPTRNNILTSRHPYVKALKSKLVDPIDAALKDSKEVTKTWEIAKGVSIEVSTTLPATADDKAAPTGMYVDAHLKIGKRLIGLVDKRGESAIKSLSNSPKRVNGLLLDNVIETIEYVRDDTQKRLDKLEKDIVAARKGAKNKPDDKAFEKARAKSDWLYVEVEIADRLEDIRRSKVPNKYIDESELPISRSSFDPKGLTFRDVTYEGKAYRTLGLTSPLQQSSMNEVVPAYNVKTGESVYLRVVSQTIEEAAERAPYNIVQVHNAPQGVNASDFKTIAEQLEKAKAEAEKEAEEAKASEANSDDIPLALSQQVAGGNINKADAIAIVKRLDSRIINRGVGTVIVNNAREYPDSIKRLFKSRPELVNAPGFLHDAKAYINLSQHKTLDEVEETYIHERFRHFGFRQYLGQDVEKVLIDMHNALGREKVVAMLNKLGVPTDAYIEYYSNNKNASPQDLSFGLMDELLAYLKPNDAPVTIRQKVRVWITKLKIKLRKMGYTRLAKYSEKDMLGVIHGAVMHLENNVYDPKRKRQQGQNVPAPMLNPTNTIKQIGRSAAESAKRMHEKGWKDVIKDPIENNRKHWLGIIPRRYLKDLASNLMPSFAAYMRRAKQMEADRNELMNAPAKVVDGWREYAAANPKEARQLTELMHETTIVGIDPSKPFEPIRDNVEFDPRNIRFQNEDLATGEYITPEYVNKRIKELKAQAKERSGEGTAKFMERIKYLKQRLAQQRNREDAQARISEAWDKLSPEGQKLYEDVRDSYSEQHKEYRKALEERIQDEIADERHREAFKDVIRKIFETQQVEGPYFPLARFGDFFGVIKDANDNVVEFSKFETKDQRRKWAEERQALLNEGEIIQTGKLSDNSANAMQQVDPKYHNEVMQTLDMNKVNGPLMDEVNQIYLNRLPASSMRKQFIHRKKTAGFNPDAMRAYSHNMFHGAYQLARLRHSHKMQVYLDDMDKEAAIATDNDKAKDIYNEMVKRHEWAMNPKSSPWAAKATSLGFAWYLGVTPAAAFVNTTQTWMVGLPVLGSRYGFVESAKALLQASIDFMKGGFHVDKALTDPKERAAFKEFERRGLIDKTLAHDLAGVSEGGLNYSSTMHKVMGYISFFFHHAERYNREVTAMAAFRLARKAGEAEPLEVAEELTLDSHFDYSNAERARFMQNDAAKVLLLFRQHSLNMTYRLLRDTNNAMRGESAEVKRQARRQLTGILGMTGLFAGTAGLPFMYFGADIIGSAIMGDEDEPWEFEVEFRKFLADHIGETAAHAVVHGVADVATGATISSRIGMNNLWFREADPTLEGRGLVQYYAEQALGPVVGMAFSAGTAWDIGRKGQLLRGMEYALPKVLKDSLRGLRYIDEGVTNIRGDALINETSGLEEFYQVMGFTPTRISETYEQNSAIKGYEKSILYRRQLLINQYATAKRTGDKKYLNGIKREIEKFNKTQPDVQISRKTLLRSMRTRQRYSDKAQRGIQIDDRLQEKLSRLNFISE